MFKVGQKVVCINGNFDAIREDPPRVPPVEGNVYTVSKTCWSPDALSGVFGPSIKLLEIPNSATLSGVKMSFSTWRFRPLQEWESGLAEHNESTEPALVG